MSTEAARPDFRFSPRTNTAERIAWHPWGAEAFERARREGKLVLLSISAVWCHWCHVMDETTYSDAAVQAIVGERYVAVRVDADRQPDVDARYNMGGWPTTAVLSADGDTITGATYVPPKRMRAFLEDVADFAATRADELTARLAESRALRSRPSAPAAADDLDSALIERVREALVATYDRDYGGFGVEPKFPQTDALEFLVCDVRLARASGGDAAAAYDIAAATALAMGRGGIFDPVEGGFFRYATRRDWSVPHFEKLAADQGAFMRIYAGLYRISHNAAFRTTLASIVRYVRDVLVDPVTRRIGGSQDADETYFALPLDERRAHGAPFVDRRAYTSAAAGVACGLFAAADALDDDSLAELAAATLDAQLAACLDDDGLARHVIDEDGSAHVRGLLDDQAWMLRALLDAHAATGAARYRERAIGLADAVLAAFVDGDGALLDRRHDGTDLGRTRERERPLRANAVAADAMLQVAAMTGDERYTVAARRTLAALQGAARRAGPYAALMAAAVARAATPGVTVVVVGDPHAVDPFRDAARRLPHPFVTVTTFAPDDPVRERQALPPDVPRAYVCIGTRCAPPVREAAGIRAAYDVLHAE